MSLPLLQTPDRWFRLDPQAFWVQGLLETGRLASAMAQDGTVSLEHGERTVPKPLLDAWRRLLGLEWLVASVGMPGVDLPSLSAFAAVPLFGPGSPTARALARRGAALAIVPLAGAAGRPPSVAALVLVAAAGRRPADHRAEWPGAAPFLERRRLALFALRPPDARCPIEGRSWMLGAALAARCLAQRDGAAALALARDWLPTGAVASDGAVRRVGLGNKCDLPDAGRRWLLPAGLDLPPGVAGGYAQAATLDIAWNHLRQQGTVADGTVRPWPERLDTLHSFVSGAVKPVLAAALLARPRRLVLWRSPNRAVSRRPADAIRAVLRRLRPALSVACRELPSDNMAAAEAALERGLRDDLRSGRLVLFNVTQGNRLMAFAAHTLARRYPALWLLYRDNDAHGLDFGAIRYDGRDFPLTFSLTAQAADVPDICWPAVFKAAPPPPRPQAWTLLSEIAPARFRRNGIVAQQRSRNIGPEK